jgi:hypothetical protein
VCKGGQLVDKLSVKLARRRCEILLKPRIFTRTVLRRIRQQPVVLPLVVAQG